MGKRFSIFSYHCMDKSDPHNRNSNLFASHGDKYRENTRRYISHTLSHEYLYLYSSNFILSNKSIYIYLFTYIYTYRRVEYIEIDIENLTEAAFRTLSNPLVIFLSIVVVKPRGRIVISARGVGICEKRAKRR